MSPPLELTFSHYSHNGDSFIFRYARTMCTTTILEEPTQNASENEEAPKSVNCLPPAQHQTGETPLEWVNRKLCAFLRMFSGASLLDQGWKVQCRGKGNVQTLMSPFWRQRYWSHWWSLKVMTNHNFFNPTSLWSRDCKLKTLGAWNGHASLCIDLLDGHSVLNTDAEETPGISYVRDPYHCCPTPVGQGTLLYKLTWNLGQTTWKDLALAFLPSLKVLSHWSI